MAYQVLARKWRPRSFAEMVGQEHVLKALINALDHKRLHHAYLFTGTRGVGKTTVARILAKCLNCETGIGSSPCGHCSACVEIAEGRFVDLLEVDAASKTKVEDTRDLLDNVQYSPTRGRFKIYLIDEVHMLSNSSFNALLKTLEEPPEHVKFLLATTDPQKLPATILSRCLQFNLKNMSPDKIVGHLTHVLNEEAVPYETAALWQLARSADGSMRDALSLTDQAIAFGRGKLSEADVSDMLGTIDQQFTQNIVTALARQDAPSLLQAVAEFAERSPDYEAALADLQTLLHRIAIAQAVPEALDNSFGDRQHILALAAALAAEDVQLFYQMALMGVRDVKLSTVPRSGFEMVLLRMLAFKPQGVADIPVQRLPKAAAAGAPAEESRPEEDHPPAENTASAQETDHGKKSETQAVASGNSPLELSRPAPIQNAVSTLLTAAREPDPEPTGLIEPAVSGPVTEVHSASPALEPTAKAHTPTLRLADFGPEQWLEIFEALDVQGVLKMILANLSFERREQNHLYFVHDSAQGGLLDAAHADKLAVVLSDYFSEHVRVKIRESEAESAGDTPAKLLEERRLERRETELQRLREDPLVKSLQQQFMATLDESSLELYDD